VVGEELEVVRSGKVVGRLAVESLSGPEKRYPEGCAVCKLLTGSASPGDAVRRGSK